MLAPVVTFDERDWWPDAGTLIEADRGVPRKKAGPAMPARLVELQ
jgi:hypothetical protein